MTQGTEISKLYTITEMSLKYDVTLRTLRFYEQCGFLSPIRRGAHRLYTERDVVKLQIVKKGKLFGFSLTEIKRLMLEARNGNVDDLEAGRPFCVVDLLTKKQIAQQISILEKDRERVVSAIEELALSQK